MLDNDLLLLNAEIDISSADGKERFLKLHALNADCPMNVALGKFINDKLLQLLNASLPIYWAFGRSTLVNDAQFTNEFRTDMTFPRVFIYFKFQQL
jgi:hypothetical protein